MSHSHSGHSHGAGAGADRRKLTIALALILGFMAAEVVTGIVANSLALLSDAAHMLTDAAAIGFSLVAIRLAARPAEGKMTFGLKRVEILSAQANGITLLVLAGIIAIEAVSRLISPPPFAPAWSSPSPWPASRSTSPPPRPSPAPTARASTSRAASNTSSPTSSPSSAPRSPRRSSSPPASTRPTRSPRCWSRG
jgi:cell division septation protein DedD